MNHINYARLKGFCRFPWNWIWRFERLASNLDSQDVRIYQLQCILTKSQVRVSPPTTRSRNSSVVCVIKKFKSNLENRLEKKKIFWFVFAVYRPMFRPTQDSLPTFDPIFFSMSRTRTFCWMYMSSGDFPGASSRFIPPSPVALWQHTNTKHTVRSMVT